MQSMENIPLTSLWPGSDSRFSYSIRKIQTLSLNKYSSCFGGVEYTDNSNDLWNWYRYKCLSSSRDFATEFSQVLCRIQPLFFSLVLTQQCQNSMLKFSRPWPYFNARVNEKSYHSSRIWSNIERHCWVILWVHHLKTIGASWDPLMQRSLLHKNENVSITAVISKTTEIVTFPCYKIKFKVGTNRCNCLKSNIRLKNWIKEKKYVCVRLSSDKKIRKYVH